MDTPATGTNVNQLLIANLDEQCKARHERSTGVGLAAKTVAYENRETLIELVGKSGSNGKVGNMREDISEIQAERKAEKKLITKVVLYMFGAVIGSSAAVQAVIAAWKG